MKKREGYPSLIAVILKGERMIVPIAQDIARIDEAIASLTDKEAKTVRKYYGLNGVAETQYEIGQYLSVTPCRIGQILHKAMRKLHHPSRKKAFERCLDDKNNRTKILEEDVNTLTAEIQRLKDGVKNATQSLGLLVGFKSPEELLDMERDLKIYFERRKNENR